MAFAVVISIGPFGVWMLLLLSSWAHAKPRWDEADG